MTVWRRLIRYLSPYRGALVAALVAMLILAATTGLYPILLDLLTTVLMEGPEAASKVLDPVVAKLAQALALVGLGLDPVAAARFLQHNVLVLFGAVVLVKVVCQAARFFSMGWIAQQVIRDIRAELFRSIVEKGAGSQATGFLVSRVVNDVTQVERAATYAIPVLIGDGLRVVALGTVCLVQYFELSLVSLIVLPVAVFPIVQFGRLLKRYAKQSQQALAELTNRITETLGGMQVVHTYGREEHELRRFEKESVEYVRTMMKGVIVRAVQTPAMELIGVAAMLVTMGYAVGKVDSGELRPGEVVGFLLALVLLYEPIKAIGRLNTIIMPGIASAERVFEVVDRPPDVEERPDARVLASAPETVRFEGVSFSYRNDGELALRNFDLTLPRGKMIALVGPSGGGKSTAAALLPRLFDVTDGRITFDGIDVRDLTVESLRAQIAMVAQETYLFNDSIRANIAYGRDDASEEEIITAAKQAYAHDFIMELPGGYDARAGERGVQISGGQRQRIAIARAFLRNAPILILDEATSALDVESELVVQRALDALLENRTALVIAHRLSTVRRADEIVVLDRGSVVERGTHQDLIAQDSAYARLVRVSEGTTCI